MKKNENESAVLIVNAHSNKGDILFSDAEKYLKENDVNVDLSYCVKEGARIPEIIKDVIEKGYKLIILGGGDGTISSVSELFAYKNITLGILPLGTCNSLARTLDIPLELKEACKVIASGKRIKIDLGKINDIYFTGTANIGYTAKVAADVTEETKKKIGRFAYIFSSIKVFLNHVPFHVELAFRNGNIKRYTALEILIANTKHQGGIEIATNEEIDNSKIFLMIVAGGSKWILLKMWIALVFNKHLDIEDTKYSLVEDIWIKTRRRKPVDIDGEIITYTPVHLTVVPKALNVIVP